MSGVCAASRTCCSRSAWTGSSAQLAASWRSTGRLARYSHLLRPKHMAAWQLCSGCVAPGTCAGPPFSSTWQGTCLAVGWGACTLRIQRLESADQQATARTATRADSGCYLLAELWQHSPCQAQARQSGLTLRSASMPMTSRQALISASADYAGWMCKHLWRSSHANPHQSWGMPSRMEGREGALLTSLLLGQQYTSAVQALSGA